MKKYEIVPVVLKRYHVADYEVRIHCREDNGELVQGWLYHNGDLTDTILTIDRNKGNKLALWFLRAAS